MISYLKIDTIVQGTQTPPFFIGSLLRGSFGMALKQVACIHPSYLCEGCFASSHCVYYRLFEQKNQFHPFRFGIRLAPDNFDFSLYLFGNATESSPYILSALKMMVENQGFGKERVTMKLRQISIGNQIVYDGKQFDLPPEITPKQIQYETFFPNITLQFVTPLRIKENNHIATRTISLHTIINTIHQRVLQFENQPQTRLGYHIQGEKTNESFKFIPLKRYSNRQKKEIPIGGIKGDMTIKGLDLQSYHLLKIGEIIGVGKQTVFGLGSYHIKEEK